MQYFCMESIFLLVDNRAKNKANLRTVQDLEISMSGERAVNECVVMSVKDICLPSKL